MSATPPSTASDWPRVLARVEQALAQAVAQIQEREQALADAVGEVPRAPMLDFRRFQERRDALDACPERARQHLVELEAALCAGEEALRQWLARAETLRRQLATGVGRAVG
jgi:hypothetical protein